MKTGTIAIAIVIVGALAFAACGGTADPPESSPDVPAVVDGQAAGGTAPAGHVVTGGDFVGMSVDQAGAFAEELGREWRVGREDGVDLPVTADLIPGRVTFTIEGGFVTGATIEVDNPQNAA
jgi:hypothetical protein